MKTKVFIYPCCSLCPIYVSYLPLPPVTTETHRALKPSSQNESGPLRGVQLGHRNFPSSQARTLLHIGHCPASLAQRGKDGFPTGSSGTSCAPTQRGLEAPSALASFNTKYTLIFDGVGVGGLLNCTWCPPHPMCHSTVHIFTPNK